MLSTAQEEYVYAVRAFAARAALAREDPVRFFDLCMVEEHTQRRLRCAPHQRVILSFIHHPSHDRAALMLPIGVTKTTTLSTYALWQLGCDATARGAFVSATQGQAEKPLNFMKDQITENPRVRVVFPELRASIREADKWTQSAFTVARPPGIRDPSMVAIGMDGNLPGARLSFIGVDDILNRENTATAEQRHKTKEFVDMVVKTRLDPPGVARTAPKMILSNTAWHQHDLIHECMRAGWPTLRMDVYGGIYVSNAAPDWEPRYRGVDELRPAFPGVGPQGEHRLTAHDPDPDNEVPLWPARYSAKTIEKMRMEWTPYDFNRLYMSVCRDDDNAKCKQEWIDKCKQRARQLGITGMVAGYRGSDPVFTGLDLAVSPKDSADFTAFFTFRVMADGTRVILDVDFGRWDGPTTLRKATQKAEAYGSIIRVESNGAQMYLKQFMLEQNRAFPVKAHNTTYAGKANPVFGVEGLFLEFYNGAWAIPCDAQGRCHPAIQRFIDECIYYTPSTHTGDLLMASFFAREQAREWGCLLPHQQNRGGSISAALTAR